MKKTISILLSFLLPLAVLAKSYYVTQSGTGTGTTSSSPWSVAAYNASGAPTGGDFVYFSGPITSTIVPKTSGTANGTSRLTLDFSAATLNTANPRININGKNYLNLFGGGSWSNGVFTQAGVFGPGSQQLVTFNGSVSNDVTVSGFYYVGGTTDVASFVYTNSVSNLVVENNYMDNVRNFCGGDQTLTHDIVIRNNYARTSLNITDQTDIVSFGDAYNVTIEGNKFIQRTEGNTVARHNDVIQCYQKGGSNAGSPYGWIIRYNWFELSVATGSGDTSWFMLESMSNVSGIPACKIYSNVFNGTATDTASNNGLAPNSNQSTATFYFYNNTVIRRAGPDNTVRFLSPGVLYARNNVGYNPTGAGGTYLSWTMSAGATWNYNWFYNWNASATYKGANGGSADPKFLDIANGELSTQSGSPLQNSGDSSIGSEYSQGIAPGAKWPNPALATRSAGSWDIGAYQSSGAAPVTPPTNAVTQIQAL
jgi:hypothetical protein